MVCYTLHMSVQFEEEQQLSRTPMQSSAKGITALLISWGFAKDEKSAQTILLITVVVCIVIIGAVWLFSPGRSQGPTNEELIQMQRREGV